MKRIIIFTVLAINFSVMADDLVELLRRLGPKGVENAIKVLGRPLTRAEVDLLAQETKRQEAEAKARQAEWDARQAGYQAQAANAAAREEKAKKDRVTEERVRNAEMDEYNARAVNRDRDNNEVSAKFQDQLARQRDEDNRREEARVQQEAIEREAEARKKRIEEEKRANAEKLKQEVDAARAKAKAEAEKEKEIADHKIKQIKDPDSREALQEMGRFEAALRSKGEVANIQAKFDEMRKLIFGFTDDPKRMTAVATTIVAAIGGVLLVKHALPVVRQLVENYLFTPVLIEESSYGLFNKKVKDAPSFKDLHFDEPLKSKLNEIKTTLLNTKKHNAYYLNYLFYGLPGTGKTATARALAYESGMDFAFMTGGSVLDLLRSGKAIQKLKEVFGWAQASKNGLILFIDEADAFLGNPNKMSEELNSVLKAFLNYTGTESKNFCLILSTNHPDQISRAVLSRVGYRQQILFDVPSFETRNKIVANLITKYFGKNKHVLESAIFNDDMINFIATKTQGFSGRDLSYLVLGVEKAILANLESKVDKALVESVVSDAVVAYDKSQEFASYA